MQSTAATPDEYIASLPEDRAAAISAMRKVIQKNLPKGFVEEMGYGKMGYVVPHALYPAGYHCNPKQPLPFMGMASQKQAVTLYHMGLYAMPDLMQWFVGEYPKHVSTKLDMGKSCIRFKKPDQIPLKLIGELAGKITPKAWIAFYEANMKA
ncbi:MAG: DUF1801 domain-containing protein [Bacteroidetes bacterium]|nr:DUF1801 domain-containing protein [Bacteroidota bacterium]